MTELGSKREILMLLCTVCGYAVGLLAARCDSLQMCAWVRKVLRQFERRKVNPGLLNIVVLIPRSQNHWQSGEWLGGRESEYICPGLVIFFMHLKVTGLGQFLVASFALDVRG